MPEERQNNSKLAEMFDRASSFSSLVGTTGSARIIALAAAEAALDDVRARMAIAQKLAKALLPILRANPSWTWRDALDHVRNGR